LADPHPVDFIYFAGETIVDFLWYALRGGIEKAILK